MYLIRLHALKEILRSALNPSPPALLFKFRSPFRSIRFLGTQFDVFCYSVCTALHLFLLLASCFLSMLESKSRSTYRQRKHLDCAKKSDGDGRDPRNSENLLNELIDNGLTEQNNEDYGKMTIICEYKPDIKMCVSEHERMVPFNFIIKI